MKTLVRKKEPWSRFAGKALVLIVAIFLLFAWIESRYRIGIDSQVIRCFPDHKFFLVDLKDKVTARDRIIAYKAQGLAPYFADGTLMGKVIKGLPGDHLQINSNGVFINGALIADGFPLTDRLQVDESTFYKDEIIPAKKYLLMAPAPESYDGRYWGYVDEQQIVGKATPFM